MSTPLLSVCFSNFNHGRYLAQCFAGILNQSFPDFEVVVTDDGSTDGSQDIIREYERSDPRIKANYFSSNRGIAPAFQDIFSRMKGRYLYGGAADDFVINKDFFQKALTALEKDPRPAGFYGITGIYIAETEKLGGAMGTAETEGYNTPTQCCEGLLKYRSIVTSPSCIWRSELYFKQGGGDFKDLITHLGPQADYYLNHAMAWQYGMHYEKTPFACQRVFQSASSYSGSGNNNLWALAARLCEMEKRLRTINVSYPDIEKDWLRWRALNLLDTIKKSGVPL